MQAPVPSDGSVEVGEYIAGWFRLAGSGDPEWKIVQIQASLPEVS